MRIFNLGKKLSLSLQALILVFSLGATTVAPALAGTAMAASSGTCADGVSGGLTAGADCSKATGTSSNLFGDGGVFQTIANTLIFLVGAIAVLFLIIGGLRYVISNGDPKAVEAAKNTILYAIIGIIVSILSFAAVSFVISTFSKTT